MLNDRFSTWRITAATLFFLYGLFGIALAEEQVAAEGCLRTKSEFVCEGRLDVRLITSHLKLIRETIPKNAVISPVEVPVLPEEICPVDAVGRSAEWIENKIRDHAKMTTKGSVPPALMFVGMRVLGAFDLPYGHNFELKFVNVAFCGDVGLGGKFTARTTIQNSVIAAGIGERVEGVLNAPGTVFESGLELQGLLVGSINLSAAQIVPELILKHARFGHLDLARAKVENLLMPSTWQLSSLHDRLANTLTKRGMEKQKIPSAIVNLTGTIVAEQIYADWARVEGGISGRGVVVSRLRIQEANLVHADFRELRADEVRLMGTQFGPEERVKKIPCKRHNTLVRAPDLTSFENAKITGNFLLRTRIRGGTKIFPQVSGTLCLNGIFVGGRLALDGLLAWGIELDGAQVGQVLQLDSQLRGPLKWIKSNDTHLDLSYGNFRQVALSEAFKTPADLLMTGARIKLIEDTSLIDDVHAPARALHDDFANIVSGIADPVARAQGFAVLEATLEEMRDAGGARLMAFKRLSSETEARCWLCSLSDFFGKLGAVISQWVGGYGLRPERTVFCAVVLIAMGALVAASSREGRSLINSKLEGSERKRRFAFEAILLSVDRLIPIISLDKSYSDASFDQTNMRLYFVMHALLGLLLAGTVVGFMGRTVGFTE